ncbi:MAG: RraA family protein [Saprospiraceae bacterium]|nr:RraA family protein [Saprospiraceae bacterium]
MSILPVNPEFFCSRSFIFLFFWTSVTVALSQQPPIPFQFSTDDYQHFTSNYQGERFADGRPKVSKDILERMKLVTIEEAWSVLREHGYSCQFDQGWVMTHENPVLVGRAVTCSFLPYRPDIAEVIVEDGKKNNFTGRDKHWVMQQLVEDDVIVVDLFGKKVGAGFVGDNLANLIQQKTGTGMVVDGGCRDLAGVMELDNFVVFNRNWHPATSSAYDKSMVIGMNLPIRIGEAAVLPGDVVLGLREGVIFIPAHLALEVVETSEVVRLKDEFGFQRLREGKYTGGQIDTKWTTPIQQDFKDWIEKRNIRLSDFQEKLITDF